MDTTHPPTPNPTTTAAAASALHGSDAMRAASKRQRAQELLDLIDRRKRRITEDFYDVGVALRELAREKLYAAIGYKTFGHFLRGRKVMSRSTAAKLVTIVETMSRDRALPLGSERAFAIASLVAQTQGATTIDQIIDQGLDVDGKTTKVSDLSRREIERIARGLRQPKRTRPKERDAINSARRLQAALRKAGVHGASARAFRRKGLWSVQIEVAMEVVQALHDKVREGFAPR